MINIKKGNPAQRGAQKTGSMSYNFAFAGVSDNITLLIFDGRKNLKCRVELDETYKTGDFHVIFPVKILIKQCTVMSQMEK